MIKVDLVGTPIQGPPGPKGNDGDGGKLHLVDLSAIEGPEAIGTGTYLMVPVITDAPASELGDEVDIQLPFSDPEKRIGLYATTDDAGVNLVIGVASDGLPPVTQVPTLVSAPAITGTLTEGVTLSVSTGSWTGNPTDYDYQWTLGGVDIIGATSTIYTLLDSDVDSVIGAKVRAENAAGESIWVNATGGGVVNPETVPQAPANLSAPAISGSLVVGQTISVSTGTWTNSPTSFSRQWTRNGIDIPGANGNTYNLLAIDEGTTIGAKVRATNASGNSAYVAATGGGVVDGEEIPSDDFPVNVTAPTISGSFIYGEELSVNNGSWDVIPTMYEYRWTRASNPILNADQNTYTPIQGDTDYVIGCEVRAGNSAGWSAWTVAQGASVVLNPADADTPDTLYVAPGLILPLGAITEVGKSYSIAYDDTAFNLREKRPFDVTLSRNCLWNLANDGGVIGTGHVPDSMTEGFGNSLPLGYYTSNSVQGEAAAANASWDSVNQCVNLDTDVAMFANVVGILLQETSDPATTFAPSRFRVEWTGAIINYGVRLFEMYEYPSDRFNIQYRWAGGTGDTLVLEMGRNKTAADFTSIQLCDPATFAPFLPDIHKYVVEYADNGTTRTVTLTIDDVLINTVDVTAYDRPKITPSMAIWVNGSIGNLSDARVCKFKSLKVDYDTPGIDYTYETVPEGSITPLVISRLVVDATDNVVRAPSPVTITNTTDVEDKIITVIVDEYDVEPGDAYKAVLEDWSTGVGIPHPNELVMTLPQAQNCRFEADSLNYKWFECIPKGPVPIIGDLAYGCECIRMGTYSVFQFVYWINVPESPFGDPQGKNTYMVPHKWKIYDKDNNLLDTIERPDGGPLNGLDIPNVWEGDYDGRANPMVDTGNWWYPQGTARCSIIWRNRNPQIYTQNQVYENMPVFEARIPFNSYTGFSVNGGDARVMGTFQQNGYGNWLNMPWEPFEVGYSSITEWANSPNNTDPYGNTVTGPYTSNSTKPNAGLWLKYTPFNICGKSPLTGNGGTRNERQAIPEPVAIYCQDVNGVRHVDQTPLLNIALDYLTSYASEPYHSVENGRCKPLYKGNPTRPISMRYHYYGAGESYTPPERAWYAMASLDNRADWITQEYPMRWRATPDTYGIRWAVDPTHPYFGGFGIDSLHGHQFPYWGSSLFKTPEFAMMGNQFTDQTRLYSGGSSAIINVNQSEWAGRSAAWVHQHAALAWHYGSQNSDRLYSRSEILDWLVADYEGWAANYGDVYFNPPSDIFTEGEIDILKLDSYVCNVFGMAVKYETSGAAYQDVGYSEFQAGYWLASLFTMKFYGMDAAIRARSSIAGEVFDFMCDAHAERVRQRINNGFDIPPADNQYYSISVWRQNWMTNLNDMSDVAALPHSYAASRARMLTDGYTATWDRYTLPGSSTSNSRDGQGTDLLLAAPDTLIRMGYTDTQMQNAKVIADNAFATKLAEQEALGRAAGSTWFIYSQTSSQTLANPL
jgi:hypothetical protein